MARNAGRDPLDDLSPAGWLAGGLILATWGAERLATGAGHPVLDVALVVAGVSGAIAGALGLRTAYRERAERRRARR